jgi:hypothetical protein
MNYIYIIKSFDTQAWIESNNIIAFQTEDEARKYCDIHTNINSVVYNYDKVLMGKMLPPYPKKPKSILIAP